MLKLKIEALVSTENRRRFLQIAGSFLDSIEVEEGCLDYQICTDLGPCDKGVILISQIWKSEVFLEQLLQSDRFKQFQKAIAVLCSSPQVRLYQIRTPFKHLSLQSFLNEIPV